jgi:hypothetical protein
MGRADTNSPATDHARMLRSASKIVSTKATEIVVLDAKPYRLDKTLSDYKGRDPLIHDNRCDQLVTCLLDLIEVPDEPPPSALRKSARLLRGVAGTIASQYKLDTIFRAPAYRILVAAAMEHAKEQGYIAA